MSRDDDWSDDDEALAVLRRHRVMPTEGAVRLVRMGLDAGFRAGLVDRRSRALMFALFTMVTLAFVIPLLIVLVLS